MIRQYHPGGLVNTRPIWRVAKIEGVWHSLHAQDE